MGDPNMGLGLAQAVVLHGRLGIADDLVDHQILRVREHEGPFFTQR